MISINHMFEGAIKKGALIGGALGAAALGIPAHRIAKHVVDDPDTSLMKKIIPPESDEGRAIRNLSPSEKTTVKAVGTGVPAVAGGGAGAAVGAGIGALSKIGKKKKK